MNTEVESKSMGFSNSNSKLMKNKVYNRNLSGNVEH